MENKVTALRKSWALTQDDLAFLIGSTRSSVSRIELGDTNILLSTALRLKAVFGVDVNALFPEHDVLAHEEVAAQCAELSRTIEGQKGADAERKRELLAAFVGRLPATDAAL